MAGSVGDRNASGPKRWCNAIRACNCIKTTPAAQFGAPVTSGAFSALVAVAGNEYLPWLSGDGLTAYFHRQGTGTPAVYVGTRGSCADSFDAGIEVVVGGSALSDAMFPRVSRDGQRLYWVDFNTFRLQTASRIAGPSQFGSRTFVSTVAVYNPVLSADELTLFFAARGDAGAEILSASRSGLTQMFGAGSAVANVNSPTQDAPLFITDDTCELYLTSRRAGGLGGLDVWRANKPD